MNLDFTNITETFAKQVVSTAKINVTAVIRENLNMWESKLFPIINVYGISKYEVIADILIEAGCKTAAMNKIEKSAFINVISKAVRRIHAQQGELTATQKRTVARSAIPNELLHPRTGSKGHHGAFSTTVVSSHRVGSQSGSMVVSKPVNAVPTVPGAVFSFKTALTRLRNEENGTPWNEADDELHIAFLDLCQERGASSIKELRLYIKETEQSKRDCLVQYMAKIDITKKLFE